MASFTLARSEALMMRAWLIVIACGLGACSAAGRADRVSCEFHPPGETPVENCAVRNPDGSLTVNSEVLVEAPFGDDGLAAVWIDRHLHFVSRTGKTARAFYFDNGADYFVEGLARTIRDGKMGFVNSELVEVVAPQWDFAEPFAGGFARVCVGCLEQREGEHSVIVGGEWGVIDRTGRVVVPVAYDKGAVPAPPYSGP
jgi:hypothetical protein